MFDIQHPILLAGMGQSCGAALAAAVSNAGGLGVIGGVGCTAETLKEMLTELKSGLREQKLPFGVDLLIPQVGGSEWETNKDYTRGFERAD
jgi:NAD(P)H-dependent flavin oxidoreductase YrpB (nitropropane dioxygenase family)